MGSLGLSTNGSIKEGQRVYYASLDYLMYSLSWDVCACATLTLASWKKSAPDLYWKKNKRKEVIGGNISACVASCFTKSPLIYGCVESDEGLMQGEA